MISLHMLLGLALFVILAAILRSIWQDGKYYIEYDGETYTVWIKSWDGFPKILRSACRLKTEQEARDKIAAARLNPPRRIDVR